MNGAENYRRVCDHREHEPYIRYVWVSTVSRKVEQAKLETPRATYYLKSPSPSDGANFDTFLFTLIYSWVQPKECIIDTTRHMKNDNLELYTADEHL